MQESVTPSWEIVERGVFAFASCRVCGWHSPARRAYATARREGAEHSDACPGRQEPAPADPSPVPAV